MSVFLPGSRIGVMGGGQLGRMFALAARRMGYRIHTFSPGEDTPTGQLADLEICAEYDDAAAVEAFARGVDVMTFEFENIPAETVERCAEFTTVRPGRNVLHIAQERLREKRFLTAAGLPVPRFHEVNGVEELRAGIKVLGGEGILKSASFGYDGKGQSRLGPDDDFTDVWRSFEGTRAILEELVPFEREISVIVARGVDGTVATYPACENIHRNHILDFTLVPASIDPAVEQAARAIAVCVAEKLELVGLIAVEMFCKPGGEILINELAPRPHNSGHFSFDACVTSQFEQQLRAVCGLPLGSTELLRPVAMANLLGDMWRDGEPDWTAALSIPDIKLHLYGKAEPRPGRKMGHLVAFGADVAEAQTKAEEARARLVRS